MTRRELCIVGAVAATFAVAVVATNHQLAKGEEAPTAKDSHRIRNLTYPNRAQPTDSNNTAPPRPPGAIDSASVDIEEPAVEPTEEETRALEEQEPTGPAPAPILETSSTTSLKTQLQETPERKLWEVRDTLRLDVVSMWNLEDQLSTDLERAVYRESAEHETRLQELETKRARLLQSKVAMNARLDVSEYDLERGSFFLTSSAGMSTGSGDSHCVLSDGQRTEACFPSVPFEQKSFSRFGYVIEVMELELKVPRDKALQIERQRDNLRVYFVFRPADIQKVELDTGMGYVLVGPRLVGDQVEVLLVAGDDILLRERA